jgi:hypothetical protein
MIGIVAKPPAPSYLNVRFPDRLVGWHMADLGRLRPFAGLPTNDRVGWRAAGLLPLRMREKRTFRRWLGLAESGTAALDRTTAISGRSSNLRLPGAETVVHLYD